MKKTTLRAALATLCLGAAAAVHAAPTMIGDTIDFQRLYPDTSTQYGPSIPSTTVAAGTSDAVSWGSQLIIDPEAGKISFTVASLTQFIGSASVFDGFLVSAFDTDIDSVSVLSNSTGFGIVLSHDLRSISINVTPASTFSSGTFVIGVRLVGEQTSGVPEPGTLALAALAAFGALARRRPGLRPIP